MGVGVGDLRAWVTVNVQLDSGANTAWLRHVFLARTVFGVCEGEVSHDTTASNFGSVDQCRLNPHYGSRVEDVL